MPEATSPAICSSCGVSWSSVEGSRRLAVSPVARSSASARSSHGGAPTWWKRSAALRRCRRASRRCALAPQPLAVEQLGAGLQERREGRAGRERRLELLAHVALPRKRAAAREHGQPRRGRRVLRPVRVAVESIRRLVEPPGACRRFDQVGDRPQPDQRIRLGLDRRRSRAAGGRSPRPAFPASSRAIRAPTRRSRRSRSPPLIAASSHGLLGMVARPLARLLAARRAGRPRSGSSSRPNGVRSRSRA